MEYSKRLMLVLLVFVANKAIAGAPIRVTIEHECSQPLILSVSIRNESGGNVELSGSDIPWNDGAKTLLIDAYAIGDGRSSRISGQAAIADHLATVTVPPNRVLSGKVSLPRIIAGLESVHDSSDVIVFFSVRSASAKGKDAVFYGDAGVFVIPKKGFFSAECPTLVRNKR